MLSPILRIGVMPQLSRHFVRAMATSKRIVVVGGVAGGMSAAARARRLDEQATITIFEKVIKFGLGREFSSILTFQVCRGQILHLQIVECPIFSAEK